jgi:hypothetical protein
VKSISSGVSAPDVLTKESNLGWTLRWTATGLLEAEKKFRRIKGYQEILLLKERLNPSRIPQKEVRTVEVA